LVLKNFSKIGKNFKIRRRGNEKNRKFIISGILLLLIGVTIGLVISSKFDFQTKGFSEDYQISKESQELLSKIGNAMAEVIQAVRPSVVNIYTTKKIKRQGIPFPFNDPFFRRFLMMSLVDYLTDRKNLLRQHLVQELLLTLRGIYLQTIM